MNIDDGLRILENSNVVVPMKLSSFDYYNQPDFNKILEGNIKGISIYMGLKQGWKSGSLYKYLAGQQLKDEAKGNQTIISKHSLYTISEINKFMQTTETILKNLHKELGYNANDFQKDLKCAYYQSWDTSQTDYTYFMQITGNRDMPNIFLVIDYKNPNGWSKNLKPKYKLSRERNKIEVLLNQIEITPQLIQEILKQGETIYRKTPEEINNIVIEGKVMNNYYQFQGICAIDLYQGYPNKMPNILSHEEHIETYLTNK